MLSEISIDGISVFLFPCMEKQSPCNWIGFVKLKNEEITQIHF